MQTASIKVSGMTCGHCALSVEGVLKAINGVSDAQVSLEACTAHVVYDEAQTSCEQLKSAVKNAGFGVDALN